MPQMKGVKGQRVSIQASSEEAENFAIPNYSTMQAVAGQLPNLAE